MERICGRFQLSNATHTVSTCQVSDRSSKLFETIKRLEINRKRSCIFKLFKVNSPINHRVI